MFVSEHCNYRTFTYGSTIRILFEENRIKAITEALNYKIAPKTFRRFLDDSYAQFQNRSHTNKFWKLLNKLDPAIKYTVEFQDHKHTH